MGFTKFRLNMVGSIPALPKAPKEEYDSDKAWELLPKKERLRLKLSWYQQLIDLLEHVIHKQLNNLKFTFRRMAENDRDRLFIYTINSLQWFLVEIQLVLITRVAKGKVIHKRNKDGSWRTVKVHPETFAEGNLRAAMRGMGIVHGDKKDDLHNWYEKNKKEREQIRIKDYANQLEHRVLFPGKTKKLAEKFPEAEIEPILANLQKGNKK